MLNQDMEEKIQLKLNKHAESTPTMGAGLGSKKVRASLVFILALKTGMANHFRNKNDIVPSDA